MVKSYSNWSCTTTMTMTTTTSSYLQVLKDTDDKTIIADPHRTTDRLLKIKVNIGLEVCKIYFWSARNLNSKSILGTMYFQQYCPTWIISLNCCLFQTTIFQMFKSQRTEQHCRLTMCWYFCWVWQILNQEQIQITICLQCLQWTSIILKYCQIALQDE